MGAIVGRLIATVCVLFVWGVLTFPLVTWSTLATGSAAGRQFENSDMGYVSFLLVTHGFGWALSILWLILALILLAIWWLPLRQLVAWATAPMIIAAVVLLPGSADAFFEKTDRTEAYTIMPNESAFWIPDVGNTKDNQAQFESEVFLNEKKLAVKRFIIPHAKLTNSGGYLAWDYYVPTGRLIIVDRTPFSREWVDADDRGTSKTKEGFPCQSKEGLNIIVGVSIGTSVMEKDAAKFLYRFGVNPPKGDRASGEVIFTSVYYGRSLKEVMDDVGRKKVQTLVCAEIADRTFDKANDEANLIMESVEKKSRDYFTSVGVTLDFIGWGDTFEFDKDIQKVVNDFYATQKLSQMLPILQALAQLKVQEGLGKGLGDKGLPIVVTPQMIEALIGLAKQVPTP